jgi:hypothetical protein
MAFIKTPPHSLFSLMAQDAVLQVTAAQALGTLPF